MMVSNRRLTREDRFITIPLMQNQVDAKGQGFNNVWYVATTTGTTPVVTTKPTSVPTMVKTTSPPSGGYGGGY